jgi:hypothetical protein
MIAKKFRAVATALVLGMAAMAVAAVPADAAVRSAVGRPLQEASALAQAHNYSAAMAKVRQAEAVGGLSAEEAKIVKQMKDYLASVSGGSVGEGPVAAQAKFQADWNARRYNEVIADEDMLRRFNVLTANSMVVIAQAYEQLGNYRGCVRYAEAHAGAGAEILKRGGICAFKAGDDAGSLSMALRLVGTAPSQENWGQLLRQAERARQLSDPQTLDIYRLRYLTNNMGGTGDYFTLAQMLIAGKIQGEAASVVDHGAQAHLLVDQRAQRLITIAKQNAAAEAGSINRDLAAAQRAPRGDDLVKIGERFNGLGRYADGVSAIQAGIAKGVADPDTAQIRLAIALFNAKQKPQAIAALAKVNHSPNAKMIASMWELYFRQH